MSDSAATDGLAEGAYMHVSGLAHVIAGKRWLSTACEEGLNSLHELLHLLQVNSVLRSPIPRSILLLPLLYSDSFFFFHFPTTSDANKK